MTMQAQHPMSPSSQRSAQPRPKPVAHQEIKYQSEAANYIAAMIAELRQISGKAGFDKLVGVLDAAYYEAYSLMDSRTKPNTPGNAEEKTSPPLEPSRS